jgi:aspartyl-tRNA synthetase
MGIDRWAALFSYQTNIREVMAFPKTQSGADLMLEAPSPPEDAQYSELGLRFVGMETTEGPGAAGTPEGTGG